ncbi:MAG: hypothetical protein WCK67_03375 [bacterium]
MDILENYQEELKDQALVFLDKIEKQVGKEMIDAFYASIKPQIKGNRWYDHDPLISKTIELLRVVPPEIQKKAAEGFLQALKQKGLTPELLNEAKSED